MRRIEIIPADRLQWDRTLAWRACKDLLLAPASRIDALYLVLDRHGQTLDTGDEEILLLLASATAFASRSSFPILSTRLRGRNLKTARIFEKKNRRSIFVGGRFSF